MTAEAEQLGSAAAAVGAPLQSDQSELLLHYLDLLYEANTIRNLTAVPRADAVERHLVDSLAIAGTGLLPPAGSIVDVGSGAGLPGVAIAAIRPRCAVTLLESRIRRCEFLAHVVDVLGLRNATVVCSRAEDYARAERLRFDLAVSRALAPPTASARLLGGLISHTGTGVVYASEQGAISAVEAVPELARAGYVVLEPVLVALPITGTRRAFVPIQLNGASHISVRRRTRRSRVT